MTTEPDDQPDAEHLAEMARQKAEYDQQRRGYWRAIPSSEDCAHTDLECNVCIECGKDCTDDLIAKAEAAADAREDR